MVRAPRFPHMNPGSGLEMLPEHPHNRWMVAPGCSLLALCQYCTWKGAGATRTAVLPLFLVPVRAVLGAVTRAHSCSGGMCSPLQLRLGQISVLLTDTMCPSGHSTPPWSMLQFLPLLFIQLSEQLCWCQPAGGQELGSLTGLVAEGMGS